MKKFAVLFVCIFSVLCFMLAGCYFEETQIDISKYEEERNEIGEASKYMPELADLGNYNDVQYRRKTIVDMFKSETLLLFVEYDEENYNKQKQIVAESYTFLEEPIVNKNGEYIIPVAEFEFNDYDFKIFTKSNPGTACKSFGLIGSNNEENKLCYAYFYDIDLDFMYVDEDNPEEKMTAFMQKYFFWE